MNNLYNSLAEVYEAMYSTFIDYEDEFNVYSQLVMKYNCHKVLEIGCGTGNLANRFATAAFEYTGLDRSEDMLAIAKRNNPDCTFVKGDMQNFKLPATVDAAIITGRTISYLLTDKEVMDSLSAIHNNLRLPGIVSFDFIDASKFIPLIGADKIVHTAAVNNKQYRRESFWRVNHNQSWAFDWRSVFYEEKEDGKLEKIGEDNSTIRAFTKDDIVLFLQLAGFKVNEMIARRTYAFDTFVVVAEK